MKDLNVIIAGAGIGGLTAANALRNAGYRVHVYERATRLEPIGAAISIWPNGVNVLHALGLGEAIREAGGDMRGMSYSDSTGKCLTRFSLGTLYEQVNQHAIPIARAELQRILLESFGLDHISLGVAVEGYREDNDGVSVQLSTGETIQGDLLIVANGTHSTLRNNVTGKQIDRRYCGYVNWNGRIYADSALGDSHEWAQYVGEHKRVSLMPMGGGEFYFFFDVPLPQGTPNIRERYREELNEHFAEWPAPVQRLIEQMDPAMIARLEIYDTERLPCLVSGRVALLGDAAHAMTPNIGQGGCQAMEDAWVLTQCLTSASHVDKALYAYQQARADRVASLVIKARERAAIIHGEDPQATQAWYEQLALETGEDIIKGLVKTVQGGPLQA